MEFHALAPWHLEYMGSAKPVICEDTRGIVAIEGDKPIAVCVLDNWSHNSCMIHIWIENPIVLKHGFAEEVFKFVFDSGRNKIIGVTPSDNQKALKFIKHIGFVEFGRVKDGHKVGVDFILTEMDKETCRFYRRRKNGRQKQSSTTGLQRRSSSAG